jgi:hypothetical protein
VIMNNINHGSSRGGNDGSSGRYLTKTGVDVRIATKVHALSVSLFANMDDVGIHCFAGEEPVDRAILRATQSSLKAELLRVETEKGKKRSRDIFEEGDEDEEEDFGIECLARVAGKAGEDGIKKALLTRKPLCRKALLTRKEPLSRAVNKYTDPYMVTAKTEGKPHIMNIYGQHLSDGTVHHRRMASIKYEETPEREIVTMKIYLISN